MLPSVPPVTTSKSPPTPADPTPSLPTPLPPQSTTQLSPLAQTITLLCPLSTASVKAPTPRKRPQYPCPHCLSITISRTPAPVTRHHRCPRYRLRALSPISI